MATVELPASWRATGGVRALAMAFAMLVAAIGRPAPADEPGPPARIPAGPVSAKVDDPVAAEIADGVAARATKPSVHADRAAVERALAAADVPPDAIARLFAAVARADLPGMAASLDAFLFLTRDPEWLAMRRHFAEFLELPGVTSLDPARIRPLLAYGGVVRLPDVSTLTPETAAALAPFGDSDRGAAVEFPLVEELAPAAAEALAECDALLVFPSLRTLSAEAARALARHDGIGIVIGGLTSLPADVAAALAETRSMRGLLFPDLERLDSRPLAARLARQDHVFLPKVAALDPDQAASLQGSVGGELALPGLRELPVEVARRIAGAGFYWLRLGAAASLSPDAAAALAGHGGRLTFTGPVPFSAAAAAELAKHRNVLSLPHVTGLPADVARALAPHEGSLLLGGVAELSPEAAAELAMHAGNLHLPGLVTLTPEVARALAAHRGLLGLESVAELEADVAAELAGHAGGLALDGVGGLSTAAAEALAAATGSLSLGGLAAVTPGGAAALARRTGPLRLQALAGIERIDSVPLAELLVGRFEDLELANVVALDGPEAAAVARVLAGTRGGLSLPALRRITPRALEALLAKQGVQCADRESLALVPDPGPGGQDDIVVPRP